MDNEGINLQIIFFHHKIGSNALIFLALMWSVLEKLSNNNSGLVTGDLIPDTVSPLN